MSKIFSQPAPAHLKYFGFAIVDCGLDDPNDVSTMTNYITEVDTFSNVAQMCVNNYTDTMINRVNLMNAHCVKPIFAISSIFIYLANTNGPSGSNYDLYPNYLARWNTFKANNASILNSNKIEVFYICDEPTWNGVTFGELDTMCALVKADFPNIPIMFIEAYTEVANVQVPTTVDWIGFDHYGIYDPSTDANYLGWFNTLKSRRSTPSQKMFLVFDDEWNSGFWPGGWQPDTMKHVVQNYYNLACADTTIIGMAGFTWPGLSVGWLGARSMPQSVIDKTVQLGKLVKTNYSPCSSSGIENNAEEKKQIKIYPNPAADKLNIWLQQNKEITSVRIYNSIGEMVKTVMLSGDMTTISIADISPGLYYYQAGDRNGNTLNAGKFIKE